MTPEEEKREEVIQNLVGLLRKVPFTVEFKVKKKPTGIKVIYEVTQEQMKEIVEKSRTIKIKTTWQRKQ